MTEPIASPTLALLYLAQGHRARAQATLDEVLELEPFNGYALALRERVRREPGHGVELSARFIPRAGAIDIGAGELELRWSIPRALINPARRLDVVIAIATRPQASLAHTSIPCLDRTATQRFATPLGPASAAVALIASIPRGAIEILAVAEPQSW